MDIQQSDVAAALQAVFRQPHEVLTVALEARDADDVVALLIQRLGLTRAQATVVVDIPFRRLNADARSHFE